MASIATARVANDPAARVVRTRAAAEFAPIPPSRMPLLRGTRPLKRWRYVAVFCEELMACAASVQVGPARQTFWAVLLRGPTWAAWTGEPATGSRLLERTRLLPRRGAVELAPGRLRVHDTSARASPSRPILRGGFSPDRDRAPAEALVALDFSLAEDAGIEVSCPHGGAYVWTRKQAGIAARGTIAIDGGAPRAIEALAVVDDTAGYHARVTEWRWAAGVGVDPAGTPLAFNLVEGVNDPATGSERAVWVAGEPREVSPVSFAGDLSRIAADAEPGVAGGEPGVAGTELRFAAEAWRSRRESLLLVRSEYSAPFGTFSGTLPGGVELARGLGVVEHHRARW